MYVDREFIISSSNIYKVNSESVIFKIYRHFQLTRDCEGGLIRGVHMCAEDNFYTDSF